MHKSLSILSASVLAAGVGLFAAPSVQAAASPSTIYVMPADATVPCNTNTNAVTIRDSDTRDGGGVPSGNVVTTITGVSTDSIDIWNKCESPNPPLPVDNQITVEWVGTAGGGVPSPRTLNSGAPSNLQLGTITSFTFKRNSGALIDTVTVTSGGGGGSSSDSAAAPQTFELSLAPNDGTVCARSSESGSAGTWTNLPAAKDCTPPASKPNANLLGWATSADFPVAIAKRQVDNGWGAYETFNDEGQLTGVFIPAGGATFLSGPGNLYAIWSE